MVNWRPSDQELRGDKLLNTAKTLRKRTGKDFKLSEVQDILDGKAHQVLAIPTNGSTPHETT